MGHKMREKAAAAATAIRNEESPKFIAGVCKQTDVNEFNFHLVGLLAEKVLQKEDHQVVG